MSIQRSGSLDIRSTRTFEWASKEEIEFQTVMTLTGLEEEITRIVFSYLFDLDKLFGSQIPALIEQSKKNFEKASKQIHSSKASKKASPESYPCEGGKEYRLVGPVYHASLLFLEHMRLQRINPYLHLDIGGGSGDFALALEGAGAKMGCSVEGHTISASDLRKVDSQVPDDRYHICNASQILTYQPIASRLWNSIVCVLTAVYLEDNARNLAEFYELLAPGGLLVVERPGFLGIHEGGLQNMAKFLNEMGYALIAFYKKDDIFSHRISTLIFQKTHPHLNFPITYDKHNPHIKHSNKERGLYELDPRFMKVGDREARKKQISYIIKMQFSKVNYLEIPESVFPAKDHQLNQLYDRALKSLSGK